MRRRDNGNSGLVSPSGGSYRVVILIGHRVTVHVQSWIRAISTVRRKVSTIFYYFRNNLINLPLSDLPMHRFCSAAFVEGNRYRRE